MRISDWSSDVCSSDLLASGSKPDGSGSGDSGSGLMSLNCEASCVGPRRQNGVFGIPGGVTARTRILATSTAIICLASAAQAEERVEPSIVVTGQRPITPDAVDARVSIERTPGAGEVIADTRFKKIGRASCRERVCPYV